MHQLRSVESVVALAGACLLSACASVDIDESDHSAFFVDARVRKELGASGDKPGPHLELGWTSTSGETGPLEYSISTANLGGGMDFLVGGKGWIGFGGGVAWQLNDLTTSPEDIEDHNSIGPYVAFEGGWHATPWLEPYVRLDGMLFFDQWAQTTMYEGGLRFHPVEHAAIFVGWRHADYDFDDIDGNLNISSVELDASGLVVGLALSF